MLGREAWDPGAVVVRASGSVVSVPHKESTWSRDILRPESPKVTSEDVYKLCQLKRTSKAVEALGALVQTGCRPSQSLFYTVLKTCVAKKDLVLGRRVHALTVNQGYESDTFLCNHILRLYASHARLQEARDVFTVVAEPNAFMWSSMISAFVRQGQAEQAIGLYHQMRRSNVKPDSHVLVAAFQACARGADLKSGQQVHADMLASGTECQLVLLNCLVDMYAKCGRLEDARRVFEGILQKDVVTWNAMIAGYSRQGLGHEALRLYCAMTQQGTDEPDSVTFVCLLQACASVGIPALQTGKLLHARIEKQRLWADVTVANSLINMYAKCGCLQDAQNVFDGLTQKTVVSWTALIAGYSQQGMGQEALRLYSAMQDSDVVVVDALSFVCLLQAFANVGTLALEKGKQLHAQIREQRLQADVFVGNNLVNMYAKCGNLEEAHKVFDILPHKDVVTWTSLITGYSQLGMGQESLQLYSSMLDEGVAAPTSVTFVCLLQACANVAALQVGRQLHVGIEEQGIQTDLFVATSLINMYAKSGSMVDAHQVFVTSPKRNLVSWNALIAGYTRQGDSTMVFDLLDRMRHDGIKPNAITFVCVLTVCSHVGLVDKGREYFEVMSRWFGIAPTAEHYSCLVDLLGRKGQLTEALNVVRTMPFSPDTTVWLTLLSACRKWSNMMVGQQAFDEAVKLDKEDGAAYVLMSLIYTGAQMWEAAEEMQSRRKEIGARKQPGQSWWTDLDGLVHSFRVGDAGHPETDCMSSSLYLLQPGLIACKQIR